MTTPIREALVEATVKAFPDVQKLAMRGNALADATSRMLFALDRYWQAYEGGSPGGWDELWWHVYERERRKVENLIRSRA